MTPQRRDRIKRQLCFDEQRLRRKLAVIAQAAEVLDREAAAKEQALAAVLARQAELEQAEHHQEQQPCN